eukprot:TRINITY_DN4257_c0_g2_i1.p1 TRINITY_DN4257_c0_g2~~TRINITY_DN4257_c0_g2_i1.p1  ORF type:complete len:1339 (+),score=397.83 TRINITY_DN4257_c0_g2_i1:106-4017(+)
MHGFVAVLAVAHLAGSSRQARPVFSSLNFRPGSLQTRLRRAGELQQPQTPPMCQGALPDDTKRCNLDSGSAVMYRGLIQCGSVQPSQAEECWARHRSGEQGYRDCQSCLCSSGMGLTECMSAEAKQVKPDRCDAEDNRDLLNFMLCKDDDTDCANEKVWARLKAPCIGCIVVAGSAAEQAKLMNATATPAVVACGGPPQRGACKPRNLLLLVKMAVCADDDAQCKQGILGDMFDPPTPGAPPKDDDAVGCFGCVMRSAAQAEAYGDDEDDAYMRCITDAAAKPGCTPEDLLMSEKMDEECGSLPEDTKQSRQKSKCETKYFDLNFAGRQGTIKSNCLTCFMAKEAQLLGKLSGSGSGDGSLGDGSGNSSGGGSGVGSGSGYREWVEEMAASQCMMKGVRCNADDYATNNAILQKCGMANGSFDEKCGDAEKDKLDPSCWGCLKFSQAACAASGGDDKTARWTCSVEQCKPAGGMRQLKQVKGLLKLKRTRGIQSCKMGPEVCRGEMAEVAQALLAGLQGTIGVDDVRDVRVTHICDIPKTQQEPTEQDMQNPDVCFAGAQAPSRSPGALAACTSDADCQRVGVFEVTSTQDGAAVEQQIGAIAADGSAPAALEGVVAGAAKTTDAPGAPSQAPAPSGWPPTPDVPAMCRGASVDSTKRCSTQDGSVAFLRGMISCGEKKPPQDVECWQKAKEGAEAVEWAACQTCICSSGISGVGHCLDDSLRSGRCTDGDTQKLSAMIMCGEGDGECQRQALAQFTPQCTGCFLAQGAARANATGSQNPMGLCFPPPQKGKCKVRNLLGFVRQDICTEDDDACKQSVLGAADAEMKDCLGCIVTGTWAVEAAKGGSAGGGGGGGGSGGSDGSDGSDDNGGLLAMNMCTNEAEVKPLCTAADFVAMETMGAQCDRLPENNKTYRGKAVCENGFFDVEGTGEAGKISQGCLGCFFVKRGLLEQEGVDGDGSPGNDSGDVRDDDDDDDDDDMLTMRAAQSCMMKGVRCSSGEHSKALAILDKCGNATSGGFNTSCGDTEKDKLDPKCWTCIKYSNCSGEDDTVTRWACGVEQCKPLDTPVVMKKVKGLLKLKRAAGDQHIKDQCKADPLACKKIVKQILLAIKVGLMEQMGADNVQEVAVTHMCDIPKSQREPTESDKADSNICFAADSAAARSARALAACSGDDCQRVGVYEVTSSADSSADVNARIDTVAASGTAPEVLEGTVSESGTTGGTTAGTTGTASSGGVTTGATPAPRMSSDDDDGSAAGLIIGIVAAVLGAVAVTMAAVMLRRSRRQQAQFSTPSKAVPMTEQKAF